MVPWRSPEAKAAPRDDLPTLFLAFVTMAVALSLGRLFKGAVWIPYGVAAAILGHAMAWLLRRLGAGLLVASMTSSLFSLVAAAELVVPQATTFGFPTPHTVQVLGQALTDAQSSFRTVVPPVDATPGYLAAAVVGVCMAAFLADWAAFRMRTAFEACVPGLALFVFASVLGAQAHRAIAIAAFAAAALVFLIVQRASLDRGETPWFAGRHRGTLPSLLGTGAVLGAVAVVVALVLSPIVPGANSKPLLSFKQSGTNSGSARSTISPLVDIQARLREYANTEVFTVQADRPAYWRLTSLDQFDGSIWSSNEKYAATRGQLAPSSGLVGSRLIQRVKVGGLASIWLPAAYRPAAVDGIAGLSYSPGSASLISRKNTTDGLTYTVNSVLPDLNPQVLRQAPRSEAGRSDLGQDYERYTAVPGKTSEALRALAARLNASKTTAFDKALAIQNYLRSPPFTYNLEVPAGHSGSAIDRFLFQTQVGYCEQFAGSFGVLARLMGLPTRIAVGFQPGSYLNGTFTVQDKNAHAWPEVFLEGIGWTAFEPTPTAGNPQAEDYTGVPYAPQAPTEPDSTTPPPSAAAPATTVAPDTTSTTQPAATEPSSPEDPGTPKSPSLWSNLVGALRQIAPFLLGFVALIGPLAGSAAFVAWERRRRRTLVAGAPDARVHLAWQETLEAFARTGIRPAPAETVAEFLRRVTTGGEHQALVRLGHAVEQTAYTAQSAAPAVATTAETDRDAILTSCRAKLGRWSKLIADLDPRPGLARLRFAPRP